MLGADLGRRRVRLAGRLRDALRVRDARVRGDGGDGERRARGGGARRGAAGHPDQHARGGPAVPVRRTTRRPRATAELLTDEAEWTRQTSARATLSRSGPGWRPTGNCATGNTNRALRSRRNRKFRVFLELVESKTAREVREDHHRRAVVPAVRGVRRRRGDVTGHEGASRRKPARSIADLRRLRAASAFRLGPGGRAHRRRRARARSRPRRWPRPWRSPRWYRSSPRSRCTRCAARSSVRPRARRAARRSKAAPSPSRSPGSSGSAYVADLAIPKWNLMPTSAPGASYWCATPRGRRARAGHGARDFRDYQDAAGEVHEPHPVLRPRRTRRSRSPTTCSA